ncbi:MAG: hypothetical protein GY866_16675 [Proteobacteria bacterium]|nr:hypothetical protein [Pseudomonadota bacterium]
MAIESGETEINISGPDVLSYREIGEMALASLDKPFKIGSVPVWLTKGIVKLVGLFCRHQGGHLMVISFSSLVSLLEKRWRCLLGLSPAYRENTFRKKAISIYPML